MATNDSRLAQAGASVLASTGMREAWGWRDAVWTRPTGAPLILDIITGLPTDWRWECSAAHWERYRETVYRDWQPLPGASAIAKGASR